VAQGVVIDGYTPKLPDDEPIPLEHYAELARRGKLEELRNDWLAHPLMSSDPLTAAQKEALAQIVAGYRGADLLGGPGATPAPALIDKLAATPVPTLIITGERETAGRRAHAEKLLETMPAAREIVLTNAGHLGNVSRAIAYNAALRDFLDEVDDAT
jgi:pimeloyl-ACP methyl ester carboxylesterase